ncbi:MAG: response regulator [Dissulfurispiraceae bacterium]|jgi:two-component system NtrC family sensor kinase|nr:response regulator [Dissulfurispiraceae bacterium]
MTNAIKTKILCVDDEIGVLNSLKRVFMDEDYIFFTAQSGREGLEILRTESPQIIISDYRMPEMNGIDFLRQVRQISPETVRLVLSGYADTASMVEAINEGEIYKFIPKPWNDDELKVTVANAVERYQLYKRNMELTLELQKKNAELLMLNTQLQKLLDEKIMHLNFRNEILIKHQNILDALPVGILGIDPNNVAVLINKKWIEIAGNTLCMLGENVEKQITEPLKSFIKEINTKKILSVRTSFGNTKGTLSGRQMDLQEGQQGTIIVFSPEGY